MKKYKEYNLFRIRIIVPWWLKPFKRFINAEQYVTKIMIPRKKK